MIILYSVYYDASSLKKIDHILNSHHHYRRRRPLVYFNLYLERELIETVPNFYIPIFSACEYVCGENISRRPVVFSEISENLLR